MCVANLLVSDGLVASHYAFTMLYTFGNARQDLGLFPIHERRIILPVNMRLSYETEVGLRMEDAPEAQTNTLVDDMIRHNGSIPSDVSDADVQAKEDVARAEASQVGRENPRFCDRRLSSVRA